MTFLKNNKKSISLTPTTNTRLENYLAQKKIELDSHLPEIFKVTSKITTPNQMRSLRKLKNSKELITIKPADKNLGVVILDTTDYINQCIAHLATPSYNLVAQFPIALKKEYFSTSSYNQLQKATQII